ncbi:hypothetical protein GUJ93_ZPchr0010g8551 [Zizania palustris]|uniref:DUF7356 domain-containing protein n=1 Tax=Zizania palustris TaxID=103762 RepID=A0A8J5WB21_ZIZPA|nr:hypothetical protein GUJ93_ZPchr0010g8551 [Zizania palustris]
MGACRLAALVVLIFAFATLPAPAAARAFQGEKPSSSKGAPAPTVAAVGSHDKSGNSSNVQNPVSKGAHHQTPPPEKPPNDSKDSAHPVPSSNAHKNSPPPEGPGPTDGTDREGGGSQGKEPTEEIRNAVKCDDPMYRCSVRGEFTACLQISQDASIQSFVIVRNEGQNVIIVSIEATPNIIIDNKLPLQLAKGISGEVNITYNNPNGGEIKVMSGNGYCLLHPKQTVSDWQQPFQQLAAYATRTNPIYGVSFLVFTVVLVGVVCACCKFARRKHADGVPYQQLEMGTQAPNSGVENTRSTVDGWQDGWDDDWDDEEAPAKPSDKKPSGSISANGLSLRPQTNGKDGWDVDWDD